MIDEPIHTANLAPSKPSFPGAQGYTNRQKINILIVKKNAPFASSKSALAPLASWERKFRSCKLGFSLPEKQTILEREHGRSQHLVLA